MKEKYLEGEQIEINNKNLKNYIGARIMYLRKADIDMTGRGYFFPRYGTVTEVHRNDVYVDDTPYSINSFVEIVKR